MSGLKIKRSGATTFGTLGYYAVHNNGNVGFVTAGHTVDYNRAVVVQPGASNQIGRVTEFCGAGNDYGTVCDAAFINMYSNKRHSSLIFKSSSTSSHYRVAGTVPDSGQVPGTFLKKSGVTTGVTYGKLIDTPRWAGDLHTTIEYNRANMPDYGDSGSTVFWQPNSRSSNVQVYGMLTAIDIRELYAYYLPVDYIARQLNLR